MLLLVTFSSSSELETMLTLRRGLRTVTSLSQSRTWQAAVCSRSLRFGGVRAALKTGQIRGFRTSVPCRDSKDETLKPKAFAEADQQFKDDIMSRTRLGIGFNSLRSRRVQM